jgi:hypothetical protein
MLKVPFCFVEGDESHNSLRVVIETIQPAELMLERGLTVPVGLRRMEYR